MLRINTAADASYYLGSVNERESAGVWDGILGKELGLASPADLKPLLDRNRTPEGERLTPIDQKNRRGGYDLTFSEPKSVSIMEQVAGDKRIGQARRDSVDQIMALLVEQRAATRVWDGEKNRFQYTGNLAYIAFDHLLARPDKGTPDPNGHVHVVVPNATEWNGKRTALEIRPIKEAAPFIEAAWHALYASKLQDLGYGIRQTKTAFEIDGVSDAIIKKYSNRTATVENELERRDKELSEQIKVAHGEELRLLEGKAAKLKSPKGKAAIGSQIRERKQPELSPEAVHRDWVKRLTKPEAETLLKLHNRAALGKPPEPELPTGMLGKALESFRDTLKASGVVQEHDKASKPDLHAFHLSTSLKTLLSTDSRVTEERLLTHALKAGVGEVSLSGLRSTLESKAFKKANDVVTAEGLVSTRTMLKAEWEFLEYAQAGKLHWVKQRVLPLPDAGKLTFPDMWQMVREAGDKHLVIAGDAKGQREGQPLKLLRDWADMKPIGEEARAKKPVVVKPKLKGWKAKMRRVVNRMRHKPREVDHVRAERNVDRER